MLEKYLIVFFVSMVLYCGYSRKYASGSDYLLLCQKSAGVGS